MPDVEVMPLRPHLNNELNGKPAQRLETNTRRRQITDQASVDELTRAIAQRARKRYAAAMLPPLLVTALLLYFILTFGL